MSEDTQLHVSIREAVQARIIARPSVSEPIPTPGLTDYLDHTNDTNTFVHDALDTTKKTIRVVQIQPGWTWSPIKVLLKQIDLEDDGHVCLSYMWGGSTPTHTIYIDGKPFAVWQNLYDFLRRARKLKIKDWLWIDALCIDQRNATERGHQVRLMGEIYGLAKRVLVYPGSLSWLVYIMYGLYRINHRIIEAWWDIQDFETNNYLLRQLQRLLWFDPFASLTDSPYWHRVWIIQEILRSKQSFVIIQGGLMDWRSFSGIYRMGIDGKRGHSILVPYGHPIQPLMLYIDLSTSSSKLSHTSFTKLFRELNGQVCSEPNDRVYALLGTTDAPAEFPIDYNRDKPTLALDLLQHFASGSLTSTVMGERVRNICEASRLTVPMLCMACCFRRPDTQRNQLCQSGYQQGIGNNGDFLWLGYDPEDLTALPNQRHKQISTKGYGRSRSTSEQYGCYECGHEPNFVQAFTPRDVKVVCTRLDDRILHVQYQTYDTACIPVNAINEAIRRNSADDNLESELPSRVAEIV